MTIMHLHVQNGLERRRHERAADGQEDEHEFLWCVVCEHAFRRERFRRDGAQLRCPDPLCEGGLLFEPWEWSKVRQANPDYPEAPSPDAVYPFFGQPSEGNESRH
jgi:hypothetical protein